jgi:hypothetical protein
VRERRAFCVAMPPVVPNGDAFVAEVVPQNPMVGCDNHAARHVRVVVYQLLPSRVVCTASRWLKRRRR